MRSEYRYVLLFVIFSFLNGIGVWSIELIIGSQITTSEYIGGDSIGYLLFVMTVVVGSFVLLITILLHKFLNNIAIKLIVFGCLGYGLGNLYAAFHFGDFLQTYKLNETVPIMIYVMVSLLYAVADVILEKKLK
ncbi:hypothetical protein H0266_02290 [Halobacillus locisalis]|uniref:Uncharacterized protein n=1 Tax=Halobacillus locisalis TaxID=220753 RepID=A0A838CPF2_9BACI|nr:hypothetical protein [Halobacillus locisalis]MBA2173719.1 hypothetical protein [Halobacillus locisalis]